MSETHTYDLPVMYRDTHFLDRRKIREQYVKEQNGLCFYCGCDLRKPAPEKITSKEINWSKFPPNFLKYPIHLQHDHETGLTEGAVHNYCNAVMWQYEGR